MVKMNLLDFTFTFQVRKRHQTAQEIDHQQRLRMIRDRNLDRLSEVFPYM